MKMFNIFKKNTIQHEDFTFLKVVTEKLPNKYNYLREQVSNEFILGKKTNTLGDQWTYVLILNANLEKQFSNPKLPQFFIIKDIGILNKKSNNIELIELHILEGMLAGFRVEAKYGDLDYSKIDVSRVKEKHFREDDKEDLVKILGDINDFDINETFKIEIPEGVFYVFKNIGNGNYLSVDKDGHVYGMFYDPYMIEKIFDTPSDYLNAVKSNNFNIQDYWNSKMC